MKLEIQNEMDIMLAHRRGMQFAKFSGISFSEQTRFATAVSEICRNCLEYAMKGSITFSVIKTDKTAFLIAIIKDEGKGITNLPAILERNPQLHKGRGLGIVYARRLSDQFKITSTSKGTTVYIQKNIPGKIAVINKLTVDGWVKHLEQEPVISAYEELKIRNMQLVELTEELRANSLMVENQMTEIKKLNERLANNNERLKDFTYAISHDLKTPLSSLKLSSKYIENNPAGEDILTYHAILSRSVTRLDKTIHGLIEIIDLQNKDKQIAKEIEFEAVLQIVKDEYEQLIKGGKTRIQADFSAAPAIRYIEGYLQSIFQNLLSNSLKYCDPDRILEIKVSTKIVAKKVVLTFSDNGIGMDLQKVKNRLFVPFNRFSGQTEGKGIGLYLIKSMIESNGGSVSVDSEPGKGATFVFHLVPYINKER